MQPVENMKTILLFIVVCTSWAKVDAQNPSLYQIDAPILEDTHQDEKYNMAMEDRVSMNAQRLLENRIDEKDCPTETASPKWHSSRFCLRCNDHKNCAASQVCCERKKGVHSKCCFTPKPATGR